MMSEHKYCYANMAYGGDPQDIAGYMVVRLWGADLDKIDQICHTLNVINTELVSDALNASIGLSAQEATDLVRSWMNSAGAEAVEIKLDEDE